MIIAAAVDAEKLEEQLDWEIRALEGRPVDSAAYPSVIEDQSAEVLRRVTGTFPDLPAVDPAGIAQVNSITTTTANTTVSWVMALGQSGSPGAVTYAAKTLNEYRTIQERQRRPEEVSRLLEATFPRLKARWDNARAAYGAIRVGTQDATSFGIAGRNFVDGLKGELLERARRVPHEHLSLEQAVERLFVEDTLSNDVVREMTSRSEIISALSDIAKDRVGGTTSAVDGVWARVINHALIVLRAMPTLNG